MPVFGPYLIFRLYLYRMQKYAFFPVSPNIPAGNPSPARFFKLFGPRGRIGFLADEAWRWRKTT